MKKYALFLLIFSSCTYGMKYKKMLIEELAKIEVELDMPASNLIQEARLECLEEDLGHLLERVQVRHSQRCHECQQQSFLCFRALKTFNEFMCRTFENSELEREKQMLELTKQESSKKYWRKPREEVWAYEAIMLNYSLTDPHDIYNHKNRYLLLPEEEI